ncbi:aminoglycoside phosphotransferase family protein [Paenibacillus dokdonensis]|uniref:Aminoglycoside phosphotransferase family protein n=1 Tax=Paenibacillus dokdonensis TaxID=2567944 RepID=A0ABU6GU24_9BACL|nr:aminoglycoside phosphotransferase family protein [Paenibacillus dokdonensis]MEC0243244.1 aminoglycoside phosphotransferase family protein [Paenibacillus dokdonensis]
MSTNIYFSSNQLGELTEAQLQQVLKRFSLGELLSFEKTEKGVGNQTLFISASSGEYVLKGNPLIETQFKEEKFYVDNLSKRTTLPVPSPYLTDESKDILDWSYSLMPRLPGRHIKGVETGLNLNAKKGIAGIYARTLCELHGWKAVHFGEYDPEKRDGIRPFEGSYKTWLYDRIRYWLEDAKKYSVITAGDFDWVEDVLAASENVFDELNAPSFVMGDYQTDNILVEQSNHDWKISGFFDFTTGYFGDGIADLSNMVAMYLDHAEDELAKHFISMYIDCSEDKGNFIERFRVHMLHQRILDWGCAKATHNVTWDNDLSFSSWAVKYTESAAYLLS